jgi:hypothetical protein
VTFSHMKLYSSRFVSDTGEEGPRWNLSEIAVGITGFGTRICSVKHSFRGGLLDIVYDGENAKLQDVLYGT